MDPIAARDAAIFYHHAGSTPAEHGFTACEGSWATDADGHRCLDFHGNNCHNIGYAHPRMIAVLREQISTLSFTPRRYTSEPSVMLAEMLAALWPYGEARVLLGVTGTDAIEMALKLAYVATGRKKTLAFEDTWHGAALGALSVGGTAAEREAFPVLEGCAHVPGFWPRQPPDKMEKTARTCLTDIERMLGPGDVAALIAEPVRATAELPPDWFWPEVRALCDRTGTLLIFDEIPTGLGKTGKFFGSQHFDAAPDITVLGKSLGGGILPLSALIGRSDLNVASAYGIGHYTHQKNPVLARAGIETLRIIEDEDLVAAAARKGADAIAGLKDVVSRTSAFAAATGTGLALSVECAGPEHLPAVRKRCYERGLNTGAADGRFLTLSPPLTISDADLAKAISIVEQAGAECGA